VIEVDRDLVAVGLVVAGALVVAGSLLWWRGRRALVRRLVNLSLRLEDAPTVEARRLEHNLARLERAVERAVVRTDGASVAAARLAHALHAIPQGVVICDEHGREVFRNRAANRVTDGRQGEALVAAAIAELLDRAVIGRGQTRSLDLFGPPRRTLVLSAAPLDDGRRTVGGLVVVDDVSERRRLEAMRRDFVANISHELRTPVGALGLLAETLLAEDDRDVARRLAERMVTEAFRVARTIDDLLELSRLEAEEAPPREPVPVHLVVAEAAERVRQAAEARQIEVALDEPTRVLTVVGDRRQLVSALFNLLDNAVKYSEAGSTVDVTSTVRDGSLEISVRDRGIGIPARDLERVFERFYRVDRARSRETGGTGLGLAIVRHVARNHGGEVRVASREGEGSRFTLVLPVGPPQLASAASEAG
jgi:two-component system, OmpR family, sensor histidine kinase SenX3